MEKNIIEEELRKKFDDEYTIKMFTNFVIEFQECFQDIVPTENVIERIKNNIFDNIKIVDKFDERGWDGKYSKDGIIYIHKDYIKNDKYIKYVLFHEMLHAITSIRDENGQEIMGGFMDVSTKNGFGKGLNEAMTEYLTQIRNEKLEKDREDLIVGYRPIVEQMRRMINILGKQKILHYYFYEPDKFKNYINTQGMNYEEIERAFQYLAYEDHDVWNMGHGKILDNKYNYKISRYSKNIFDNFSKALGEINTLEDFERKYKIFQTHTDSEYDCIRTMLLMYYHNMGKDVTNLIKKGEKLDKIKEVLDRLHIRFSTLKSLYTVSNFFGQDKNKTAILLYELYKKYPQFYFNIFAINFGFIFDYFKEMDANPGEELYDAFYYPTIGSFLKEHPEIDFSDVSHGKIEESKSKICCYIFQTSEHKMYGYTGDGECVKSFKDKEDNNIFEIQMNEFLTCQFIFDKNGNSSYSIKAPRGFDMANYMRDVNFKWDYTYSEKQDIELWIQKNGKSDPELFEHLKIINNRIEARQRKIMDDR